MTSDTFNSWFSRIITRSESNSSKSSNKTTSGNVSRSSTPSRNSGINTTKEKPVVSSNNRFPLRSSNTQSNRSEQHKITQSKDAFKEIRIARGTTCDVTISMDRKLGKIVTKKIYTTDRDPSRDYRENMVKVLRNEYEALSKLKQSKYVVTPYDLNLGSKTITMEYIPFSLSRVLFMDLFPTVDERKCYFRQICQAVRYLHSHGVIHRDLKLENIMICEDACQIKLVDFGVAVLTDDTTRLTDCKGICGTEPLMAPEVLSSITYKGQPADCWSLGIIMYQMFNVARTNGRWKPSYPWAAARMSDNVFKKYIGGDISVIMDSIEDDDDLKKLILLFLKVDVNERITMDLVVDTKFILSTSNLKHNHDRTLRVSNKIFGAINQ